MKIYGVGYHMIRPISETAPSLEKKRNEKAFSHRNIPAELKGNPVVNLSQVSKPNQRANNVIKLEPYIRLEKVRALRKEISRGTYQIDCDKIAENMLGVFTDDIAGFVRSFTPVCH
jgi:negative regulator of flagellin synthesis FlgM